MTQHRSRPASRLPAAWVLLLMLAWQGTGADEPAAALREARLAAQQRMVRLLDEDRPAEAIAPAEEVVTLTRQIYGEDSLQLATPLANLATTRLRSGDLDGAEDSYLAAIDLVERQRGALAPALLQPLAGLGETYLRLRQYPRAVAAFERALRVNHANEGFYNLDQLPIRDGLTEGYLGVRDLGKANFHQEAQLGIQQRRREADDPELVAALYKLGAWYERSGQPAMARAAYQRAERLQVTAGGRDNPALVDTLLAQAASYRLQAQMPAAPDSAESPETLLPMASSALRRALEVVDRQSPPDPALRARVLVEMGDLQLLSGRRSKAVEHYTEAWNELARSEDGEHLRDGYFGTPIRIAGPAAPRRYLPRSRSGDSDAGPLEPGHVVLRYGVDTAGRVTNTTVIEAEPPGLLDGTLTDTLRRSLFRPRFEAGKAVTADGLVLRHEFEYAPNRAGDARREPALAPADGPLEQPRSSRPPPRAPADDE